MAFTTPFKNTWTAGDNSEWSGFFAHPQQQQILAASPTVTVHPAVPFINRVILRPTDQPGTGGETGTYSALWSNVGFATQRPTNGDSAVYAFALRFPSSGNSGGSVNSGTLFWELHNTGTMNVAPNNGDIGTIAPHAIIAHAPDSRWTGSGFTSSGVDTSTVGLSLRIAAGDIHAGGVGTDRPQIVIPGLQPVPLDVWVNIILAYTFSESNTGRVRLWAVKSNAPQASDFDAASPLLDITGVYTSDFDSTQPGVHDSMWSQQGAYNGDRNPPPLTTVDLTGEWVEGTVANAITKITTSFGGSVGGGPPPSTQVVQFATPGIDNTGAAVSTIATTPTSTFTAGTDALVAVTWMHTGSETCTVADGTHTYTSISDADNPIYDATNHYVTQWFLAKNLTAVHPTVTATLPGARQYPSIVVWEVNALNSGTVPEILRGAGGIPGVSGTDSISTGSEASTTNGDFIAALLVQVSPGTTTITPGTGFTQRWADTAYGLWAEDMTQTAAGPTAATWNSSASAGGFIASMVALKPVAAAGVPVVVTAPTISGQPLVGSAVTRVQGTYSPAPTSFTGNWQTSVDNIGSWTNISGAGGLTDVPVVADVGKWLRWAETPSNGAGAGAQQTSNSIGPITNPVVPSPGPTAFPAAAQVPATFDVAIDGHGYVYLDSVEPSLPFRTHRAIYDISQTFVERTNVGNGYGDETQDFFLTATQNDWSLGTGRKFFRATDATASREFYTGANIDVTTPGNVSLRCPVQVVQGAAHSQGPSPVAGCSRGPASFAQIAVADATHLYTIIEAGSTDQGVHGLGAAPGSFGMVGDGTNVFLAAAAKIRKWNGAAFSDFSASGATMLAFTNNTLFGADATHLYKWDVAGARTTVFTWTSADNATGPTVQHLTTWGNKLAVLVNGNKGTEVWTSDGATANTRAAQLPNDFFGYQAFDFLGVLYIAGGYCRYLAGFTNVRPAIFFTDGNTTGLLWESPTFAADNSTVPSNNNALTPITGWDGKLLFCDTSAGVNSQLMVYDIATAGASPVADYTRVTGTGAGLFFPASSTMAGVFQSGTVARIYTKTSTLAASGTVVTSEIDFESSLTKVLRSVTLTWDYQLQPQNPAVPTVDIAYQIGGVGGTYTTLQTGVQSGQEINWPDDAVGGSVSLKITLNANNASYSPVLKRVALRAAPQLRQFRRATYIIDCTGTADQPRELRDGSSHPVPGAQQMKTLLGVARSRVPVSVTDKVHGTFTGFVDLNDPEGFDVYEVHPDPSDPSKPGAFAVRITLREV